MKAPTKVFHSESPRRDWPNIRKSAAAIFHSLGLPAAGINPRTLGDTRKKYHEKNRAQRLEGMKEYAAAHPEKNRAARKKYYSTHRQERQAYKKQRRDSNPNVRLAGNLSGRIRGAVVRIAGGTKSARTRELLGCTIPELRAHLESQFRPGMTWGSYGPVWHIDHRRPCASFDLLDPAQQRTCFHYTNLQPLFAEENLRKGDKYADTHES